jgi:hypothetical protein
MNQLMQCLRFLRYIRFTKGTCANTKRHFHRPILECLEDRTVPSTLSSITSNFNGTAIPSGDTIWFSSVLKASGLGSGPVTVHVTDQVIAFQAGGTNYSLNVPDTTITFSPTTSTGATFFDAGQNAWVSNLPSTFSGNAFLGGYAFQVATALPGGINPVTWQGNFATDTAGVTLKWQWAAAVYTGFGTDYNTFDVKPLDSSSATVYHNSDHAGTPEAFKSFLVGGARGGGGSNFTGSYSATAAVIPTVDNVQQAASISGYAFDSSDSSNIVPIARVAITLTGTDVNGNMVNMTITTDASGFYQFTNVAPGSYLLTATTPANYTTDGAAAGTVNGSTDGMGGPSTTQISGITLRSGDTGINYDFFFKTGIVG